MKLSTRQIRYLSVSTVTQWRCMSHAPGVMNINDIKIKDIKTAGNYCVRFYFGHENICLEKIYLLAFAVIVSA